MPAVGVYPDWCHCGTMDMDDGKKTSAYSMALNLSLTAAKGVVDLYSGTAALET
jgi:hypothetical protein